MSVKFYRAPWGTKVRLITGTTGLFALVAAVVLPLAVPARDASERLAFGIVPFVILTVIGVTALWMIRRFELTDDTLFVRRVFWANRIPLANIQSAEIDSHACQGAWKTMGNDGLFAMHGRFRGKRLGRFQAYVTDPANSVVLKLPGDTIVISPENPRGFLKELNRRLERLDNKR